MTLCTKELETIFDRKSKVLYFVVVVVLFGWVFFICLLLFFPLAKPAFPSTFPMA